ncbi:MAG: penicillin-binding protein 1C, partial [Pseudomonadota bacterium]
RTAAAPILFDVFARVSETPKPLGPAPRGVIAAKTAQLPPPLRRFPASKSGGASRTADLRILFPPDGAALALEQDGTGIAPVPIKIAGGVGPLTIFVDGIPLETARRSGTAFFAPNGPGFVRMTVTDTNGKADSVTVRLLE